MSKRIMAIDGYRGLLLFGMTWNHLILFPFIGVGFLHEWLYRYVYNSFGYFSNSEGFFFLAGLVSGMVYGRRVLEGESVWGRVGKRILQMYGVHVVLLVSIALAVFLCASYWGSWKELQELIWVWKGKEGIHYFLDHPLQGVILGTCFLYALPFFDILPLFMLFLAVTPFILEQLRRGRTALVIGASVLLWFITQYLPTGVLEGVLKGWFPVKLGWFHPCALQLLFIVGLTIGWAKVRGSLIRVRRIFLIAAGGLAICYHIFSVTDVNLTNAQHLGFARLSFFVFKAGVAYWMAQWFSLKPFAILGRHSLWIFAYHIVLVYGFVFFLPSFLVMSIPLQLVWLVFGLLSLWGVAGFCEHKVAVKKSFLYNGVLR